MNWHKDAHKIKGEIIGIWYDNVWIEAKLCSSYTDILVLLTP